MRSIEKDTGSKPSPGSIYPLLTKLQEDLLIKVAGEKKECCLRKSEKKYQLTRKGLKEFNNLFEKRKEVFEHIKGSLNNLGVDINTSFDQLREKTDDPKFIGGMASWLRLQENIMNFIKLPIKTKEKEGPKIIKKINRLAEDIGKVLKKYND